MTREQIRWSKSELAMLHALSKGTPEARLDWLNTQRTETRALLVEIDAEIAKLEKEIEPEETPAAGDGWHGLNNGERLKRQGKIFNHSGTCGKIVVSK